jgi:hypothetical protein
MQSATASSAQRCAIDRIALQNTCAETEVTIASRDEAWAASYTAPDKGADVLSKPYREADLLTKLRVLLTTQAQSRAEARPTEH